MIVRTLPLGADLHSRIYNWKFTSAIQYLDGQPERVISAVRLLADMFGDSGCFDGRMGALVNLIADALLGSDGPPRPASGPHREDPRLTPPIVVANMRGDLGRVQRTLTSLGDHPDDALAVAACAFATEALNDLQVLLLKRMNKHD